MPKFFQTFFIVALTYVVLTECKSDNLLEELFTQQIQDEFTVFFYYEKLAEHFSQSNVALYGFSAYFKKAASEERHHAHELIELMHKKKMKVNFRPIDVGGEVQTAGMTTLDALAKALDKENLMAGKFEKLYKTAGNDVYIQEQLSHFIKEQTEAIYNLGALQARLKRGGSTVEFLLDQELRNPPSMHE